MTSHKLQPYFLLVLIIGVIVLTYFIFSPFIKAFVMAAVFAVVFKSMHRRIHSALKSKEAISAFVSTLLIILVLFVPLFFLGAQLFYESKQLYVSLSSGGARDLFADAQTIILQRLQKFAPSAEISALDLDSYFRQGVRLLSQNLGILFSNLTKFLLNLLVFAITLYYLFKDGDKFKKALIMLSPLSDRDDQSILVKLERAINSVIKGNLTIALSQGIMTSVGLAIFGVPNFVLWGTMAAVSALIPTVGTSLIIVPAVVYLFIGGHVFSAIGLLAWGATAVGLIDNFLGPKLIGKNMRMHPLVVLFAVLGGLAMFGPVGFILGPLVIGFLFALLDIYTSSQKEAETSS